MQMAEVDERPVRLLNFLMAEGGEEICARILRGLGQGGQGKVEVMEWIGMESMLPQLPKHFAMKTGDNLVN